MKRRGCGLGCIVTLLGVALTVCLLPHLISSIYALVSSLTDTEVATQWLWGDWISTLTVVQESRALYMVLAEGPVCCAGILALLIVILGAVAVIAGVGGSVDEDAIEELLEEGLENDDDEYEDHDEYEDYGDYDEQDD